MDTKKTNLVLILLIPICIAINIVAGQLAILLKLPVFVDTIGTILIAIVGGPLVGAVTGVLSNLINAIADPVFMPFALVALVIGLVSGLLAKRNMFSSLVKTSLSILIISICGVVVSIPIVVYVFGGITSSGSTFFTALLLASGKELMTAVLSTQVPLEILDKIISTAIALFIIKKLPERYLIKLPLGRFFIKNEEA